MSTVATPAPNETALQRCLREMRAQIAKIEALPVMVAQGLAMGLRHQMIELTSLVNDLQASLAARRMVGEAEPLVLQAPVEEMELFVLAESRELGTLASSPTVSALPGTLASAPTAERAPSAEAILRSLHRVGDHSLDGEEGHGL